LFIRNLLFLISLSSCSVATIDVSNLKFDDTFLNSDKFEFNKCLTSTNEKIQLSELQFDYLAENINSQGLQTNTRYMLSLIINTEEFENTKLDSMRLNNTNYISSNMADSEIKVIKNLLIVDICETINQYVK
tara:strand:+ start:3727 stop:4122 length:396 start_codon:yes stop_codon:yes gene_type:complete